MREPFIRVWGRVYPELERFESVREREAAWRRARDRFSWSALLYVLVAFGVYVLLAESMEWLGVPRPWVRKARGVLMFAMMGAIIAFPLVLQATIRRRLRRDLVSRGVPICIRCGYDLRGIDSDQCPECGAPVGGSVSD